MNQPSDTFAQRTRRLASEVQRLRDWAGGDPSRLGPVADALVEVTAHRLAGHAWAEAAAGAQEAVSLSAKLLAQHGPVGPYTAPADAVRSITALVHLALIQSAAGLHAQAEQVLAAAFGLRTQLSRIDLDSQLEPRTVAWALLAWSRAALADGRVADANARIDAAVALAATDEEFLAVDVDRAAADARWAAGWPEPSVEFALRAVERYDQRASAVLQRPSSTPEGVLERLSEPLFGLYSETADRALAIGAPGLGLELRRRLVDRLGALAVRTSVAQLQLVSALGDLADDLRGQQRTAEAKDVAELASSIAGDTEAEQLARRQRARLGSPTSWSSLPAPDAFGVETGANQPTGRLAALRGPADAAEQRRRSETEAELARRSEAARADELARAERERADRAEAERLALERESAERAAAAAAAEAERIENRRKREERIAEHERLEQARRAEQEAALRARVSDETPQERVEREELERLAAELAELEAEEAARAEREAAELAALEAQLAAEEAEREQARAERAERERIEAEEVEQERLAVEQAELERQALAAQRAEAERLRLAEVAQDSAREQAQRDLAERSSAEQAERAEAEQLRLVELAEAQARERAEREEAERLAAELAERAEVERLAAELAEREEAERLAREQAERAEAEAQACERAEREEAERLARERAEREEVEQPATERADRGGVEQDLERARARLDEASTAGKRRDVRAASEELVDMLRDRYAADPEQYLTEFLDALDQLATARWQAGDWWGSRGPAKEAKTLRKEHGR